MKELTSDGASAQVSCRALKLARQSHYRWLCSPITERDLAQAYRANPLHNAHTEDPEFGYRFHAVEAESSGEPIYDQTVWRLCRGRSWWTVFGNEERAREREKAGASCSR